PGIVPVYELGAFADRRPFFTMKLVKGRTLAEILRDRPDPAHDLPRLLATFEAIAQTVAYAHARGVIHRDLKPSNVMVGSFGEVQVMDWGLAKILPRGGVRDDVPPGTPGHPETVIATARSRAEDSDLSRAGSGDRLPRRRAGEAAPGRAGARRGAGPKAADDGRRGGGPPARARRRRGHRLGPAAAGRAGGADGPRRRRRPDRRGPAPGRGP